MQRGRSRWSWFCYHVLPLIAAALTIIGARLWLISQYATSLPIADQWGAEGYYLLKPWYEGRLSFMDLLDPHNEHRIFLSRLLTLALTYLNGQWDSMPEMVFNAIFCGLIGVFGLALLLHHFGDRHRSVLLIAGTLWLALPYAHENTLWGFQSSFYFLLFFSLLCLWGLLLHRPFSLGWFAGVLGAIAACLSMGSGFFAIAVVGLLLWLDLILKRRRFREVIPTVLLAGAIIAISLYFRIEVPGHATLKSYSIAAWLVFFGRCLAWPLSGNPLLAVVAYAPFVLLITSEVRRARETTSPRSRLIQLFVAVGIWVVLQAAAVAHSRGGDGTGPIASRYLDMLGLGVVINVVSLCVLLNNWPQARYARTVVLVGSAWLLAIFVFAGIASRREIQGQYGRKGYLRSAEKAVRAYLATKDRRYLEGEPHPVPYPNVVALAGFLDDNTVAALLPASARLPLHLEKNAASDDSFTQPGYPTKPEPLPFVESWGSYSSGGAAARGSMVTQALRPHLPYLEIDVAGGLDDERSLVVEAGGHVAPINWLERYSRAGDHPYWRTAYAPVIASEVRIRARDDSTNSWFAFREPRELGRLAYYSYRLLGAGKEMFLVGIALCSLLVLQNLWRVVREQRLGRDPALQ
jgi:hypothetical protein